MHNKPHSLDEGNYVRSVLKILCLCTRVTVCGRLVMSNMHFTFSPFFLHDDESVAKNIASKTI